MKITKYASQHCVKCKLLDKMLKHMNIENIETVYIEDVDTEELTKKGIMTVPTLIIEGNDKEIRLFGAILPQDITDAINTIEG